MVNEEDFDASFNSLVEKGIVEVIIVNGKEVAKLTKFGQEVAEELELENLHKSKNVHLN